MISEEYTSMLSAKYETLNKCLNERSLRLCAAADAHCLGRGGISLVSQASRLARNTIYTGMRELESIRQDTSPLPEERIRKAGGGRKKVTESDPELVQALELLVDPVTRGDPESPLRWTCKSTTKLAAELNSQGHTVSQKTVWNLLVQQNYSLQSNRKRFEGTDHPDRDAQFQFIAKRAKEFMHREQPVISVDTKKKELIGNFKNTGSEWEPQGHPPEVNMHDFADPDLGKAIPYGVYDLAQNQGWVSVGITHDTSEFAVQTIRTWWQRMGRQRYPEARELLITADGGGSNGHRVRLWKVELQKLADDLGLTIHVCHFPPGTSKWNKIEHRMFCHITENWRGRPLLSRAVIVDLIANTTTKTGLKIRAALDNHIYNTGIKIDPDTMSSLRIKPCQFHGDWNYQLNPLSTS